MGIPILDVIRVMIRRAQKKQPILGGDSEHLHFKLIDSGLTQTQAVLLFYAISFLFGLTTLFLQSSEKIFALALMLILMLLVGVWFSKREQANNIE
jgi:UDP-N-acetylmuramyl pentapeptide phosphotransferase/UDP-N-acetylglucosamine-1-phosphate transferase